MPHCNPALLTTSRLASLCMVIHVHRFRMFYIMSSRRYSTRTAKHKTAPRTTVLIIKAVRFTVAYGSGQSPSLQRTNQYATSCLRYMRSMIF